MLAKAQPRSAAATEHGQQAPLLQSMEMSANVVFVNIDWKEGRHHRTLNANMKVLGKTITDIVQKMNPTVICMCEVGETKKPLSEEQMHQVEDNSINAWKDAATEHVQLRSMFITGAPYMTIYISGAFQCSDQKILHNLYYAAGEARTAQALVLSGPDGSRIDVINVHAPSGTKKLKDAQRRSLLTNLLQSNSQARPGHTIGNVHFLIGGDMNTAPIQMSQLLQSCKDNGSLRTEARTHETVFAKHGDLCIAGGIQANTLEPTARNHDPKHDPYGICWSMSQRTAPSYGYATEPRQHRWPSHPSADRHATEQYRDRSGTNHEQLQQVAVLQSNSCQHLQHHVIHSYTRKHFQQQHQLQRQRCRPRPGTNREELQQVGLLQSNLCHYFQHQHLH